MRKSKVVVEQLPYKVFAGRIETMYHTDPYRLLTLFLKLEKFGSFDKNQIIRRVLSWYIKKAFAQKRDFKLIRHSDYQLEQAVLDFNKHVSLIPYNFLTPDEHDTLIYLTFGSNRDSTS